MIDIQKWEDLLDLPVKTILINSNDNAIQRVDNPSIPWRFTDGGGYGGSDHDYASACKRLFRYEEPLRVVWRPDTGLQSD